ncbi:MULTISPECIES: hypothetical protein [unclassified Nocardioides]|uniref:hypothetical protein n=1 Tax=Nocardioides sp. URHA0032 TaxID=1380388 RepID=UPI00048BF01A|nr:hypothetical protein [Nocardioides sp. URHA0032]
MRRVAASRRQHLDLLRRRPTLDPVPVERPGAVRRVDQLRALLQLVDRGVLSAEEFERQERKVYRP